MQEKVSAQYKNDIYMARAQRDYELKKAAYDLEVNTKKAESEMAYQLQVLAPSSQPEPLDAPKTGRLEVSLTNRNRAHRCQVAKTKQRIEEEKMQVLVVERTQQITLQEQEITRREKELEARVMKPAEAERYRLEKLAEAER